MKISNGKKKGKGNTKNGNKYLSWAFVEAANFAIRFSARKEERKRGLSALKTVAHKLCGKRVAFDVTQRLA